MVPLTSRPLKSDILGRWNFGREKFPRVLGGTMPVGPCPIRPSGIPAGYLVDGDTGKILALLTQVRGPALKAAIEQGLSAKGQ